MEDFSTAPDGSAESVEVFSIKFDVMDEVAEEIEDFVFLSRLGLFEEARVLFEHNLEQYSQLFPVLVEYLDMLLEEQSFELLSNRLLELPADTRFSEGQNELLNLLKVFCDACIEQKSTKGDEHRTQADEKLRTAMEVARNWFDNLRNTPESFSELEIHAFEIYISILVLGNLHSFNIGERYYQLPRMMINSGDQWDSFQDWCIRLSEKGKFWEAFKIVVILIPILSSKQIQKLFEQHSSILERAPRTDAVLTADLAASCAYLNWASHELERSQLITVPSVLFEKIATAKSIMWALFGRENYFRGAHFELWRESLLLLNKIASRKESEVLVVKNLLPGSTYTELWTAGKVSEDTPGHLDAKRVEFGFVDWDGRTPLSWAAGQGHEDIIKLLLTKNAEPDSKDGNGRSPLSRAAEKGHIDVIELLLAENAKPDSEDWNDRSPLSWAAERGHTNVINLLLAKGAKLEPKDRNGRSPLSRAAEEGHSDVIKLLLAKDAEPDSKDRNGRSPLSWAAERGHVDVINLLLAKGAKPDSKDQNGRSPLSWASEKGHVDVIKLLLTKNTEPDSKDKNGESPLSWAVERGHANVIKLLLTRDAKPDLKDRNGRSLLSRASEKGHANVIELLLTKGAKLDLKDRNGRSPLSWAAENGHENVVNLLLEKNSEQNGVDNLGWTPLLRAARRGHESVIKLLLARTTFEPNSQDPEYKRSLLMWAAKYGHAEVVSTLLEVAVDIEQDDYFGQTALSLAAENGHEELVQLLLEKKANPQSKDRNGRTPLWWAKHSGQKEVIKLLQETQSSLSS